MDKNNILLLLLSLQVSWAVLLFRIIWLAHTAEDCSQVTWEVDCLTHKSNGYLSVVELGKLSLVIFIIQYISCFCSPGHVSVPQEGEQKQRNLRIHCIISVALYWSIQITKTAQIQGVEQCHCYNLKCHIANRMWLYKNINCSTFVNDIPKFTS